MKIVTLSISREVLAKALNLPEGLIIASARMSDYGIPMFDVVDTTGIVKEGHEWLYNRDGVWQQVSNKGATRGADLEEEDDLGEDLDVVGGSGTDLGLLRQWISTWE